MEKFLEALPDPGASFRAVVKPVDGAASEGVHICSSPAEVRSAFAELQGSTNVLGLENTQVLLQEYLKGEEFVVDTVSRSGVHKCVAIWKYDKRMYIGLRIQIPRPGKRQRKFRSPEFPISRGSFSFVQVPARVPKRAPVTCPHVVYIGRSWK